MSSAIKNINVRNTTTLHGVPRGVARSAACVTLAGLLLASMTLSGCGSSGSAQTGAGTTDPAKLVKPAEGIAHNVTQADLAALHDNRPLVGDSAELWVNGMGCPQCVTNVDLELEDLPGVASTRVDLGSGKVYVTFTGDKRPSPHQLEKAVGDAGNTLVKLVVGGAK